MLRSAQPRRTDSVGRNTGDAPPHAVQNPLPGCAWQLTSEDVRLRRGATGVDPNQKSSLSLVSTAPARNDGSAVSGQHRLGLLGALRRPVGAKPALDLLGDEQRVARHA